MGLAAAGALIEEVRRARGLSRMKVAAAVGTDESGIERIERGKIDTRGSLLLAVARVVDAPRDILEELLLDAAASVEDARQRARRWLERQPAHRLSRQEIDELEALDPETLELVLRLARRQRGGEP